MSLIIRNTQRQVPIQVGRLRRQLRAVLDRVACRQFDLSVWVTDNRRIQRYNRAHRGVDRPTDVLSIPFLEIVTPGVVPDPIPDGFHNLGDIIISGEYVAAQCQSISWSIEDRIPYLCVHGICHLLGYDHETDADFEQMRLKERDLLQHLIMEGLIPYVYKAIVQYKSNNSDQMGSSWLNTAGSYSRLPSGESGRFQGITLFVSSPNQQPPGIPLATPDNSTGSRGALLA